MNQMDCVVVASLPEDRLTGDEFRIETRDLPPLGDGQIQAKVLAFTIGAGQRAGLQGSAHYAGATEGGMIMNATGVAVVEASRANGIREGDWIVGQTGWATHTQLAGDQVRVVSPELDPSLHLGLLGSTGLTAYFGLTKIGNPAAGETLVVSAAAGSVGHFAGQMGKILGCRVVGVTSAEAKGRVLVEELGFDAVVNRKSKDFRAEFKAATPERIDIYFDNTGGEVLGASLFRMAPHGRIVCCGAVSAYDTSQPDPSPRGVPGLLVNNRVRMEGFLVFDHEAEYGAARTQLLHWHQVGKLEARAFEHQGLDSAATAFLNILSGQNIGTTLVRL